MAKCLIFMCLIFDLNNYIKAHCRRVTFFFFYIPTNEFIKLNFSFSSSLEYLFCKITFEKEKFERARTCDEEQGTYVNFVCNRY